MPVPYDTLAGVYDWLVPDTLFEPESAAAAFADVTRALPAGARVLDCAAGTGRLAVGLALRGFAVAATDASPAMVERTRALAARRGVPVEAEVRAWEALPERADWAGAFDAVLCVGNSLAHAPGAAARHAALVAMAGLLRPGGLLAVTSRDWERRLGAGAGLEVADRLVVRGGRPGLVIYAWPPAALERRYEVEVAVALPAPDGTVETRGERLVVWPFAHAALLDDLRAAGLEPEAGTSAPQTERYLVTARRPAGGAGGAAPRPRS